MPIELKKLTHTYMPGTPFESRALDQVDLTIDDGEFIGIIGHTGSGKSTLVQHFNGLMKPTEGRIFVNGMDLTAKGTDMRAVRRAVGLVFQYPEYQLFEETVRKDIAFGPVNLKLSEKEVEDRVLDAVRQVGLDESLLEKSPFELSGGQKRRVAIAGVVAMKPSILVLDEPAAGLDPAGREEMLTLIKGIHSRGGVTVIMVSHSMDDVGKLCDRLIVMNHGKVALTGTPRSVFTHSEELRGMGLGIPQGAALAQELRKRGFPIPEGLYKPDELRDAIIARLKTKNAHNAGRE